MVVAATLICTLCFVYKFPLFNLNSVSASFAMWAHVLKQQALPLRFNRKGAIHTQVLAYGMEIERKIRNTIQTSSITHCNKLERKNAHARSNGWNVWQIYYIYFARSVVSVRVCCVLHTIGLDWMSAGSVFVEEVNMIGFYGSCSTLCFGIIKLQGQIRFHCYSNVQEVLKHCTLLSMTMTMSSLNEKKNYQQVTI